MSLPRSLGTFPWFIKSGDKNYCHIPAKSFENLPKCPYIYSTFSRDVAHKRPDFNFSVSVHTSAIYPRPPCRPCPSQTPPHTKSPPLPPLSTMMPSLHGPKSSTAFNPEVTRPCWLQHLAGDESSTYLLNTKPRRLGGTIDGCNEHAGELEKGGG